MKGLFIQLKMFFIFLVDFAVALVALALMLALRYGQDTAVFSKQFSTNFPLFLIIIFLFLLVFYIFNLYSFRFNKNIMEFTNSFIKGLIVSFFLSILIFYIFGDFFQLTPKTNLLIFTGIFGIIDFYFRIIIRRYLTKKGVDLKIILVSRKENELLAEFRRNQSFGYQILAEAENLNLAEILKLSPDVVAVDSVPEKEFPAIYSIMKNSILVYNLNNFYEEIFQKVATEKIEKNTILEYISKNKAVFNFIKRILDIVLSLWLIVILSPVFLVLAILIKLTSKGPIFFKHQRVSLNDAEFTIYKFRSMYTDAEKNGAVWTENNKKDPRITPVGRFIRQTHLDELPQLFNILKGDLSFVGPRPERPEFTAELNKAILYYDLRHSVKAGLTGWAQVNYKYGASVEDAKEKLKYDFYYIKNRNAFFDILIILKTLAKIFSY